jgi:hypothetical protein
MTGEWNSQKNRVHHLNDAINFYRFLYSLKTGFFCHFDKRYKTGYVLIFRSFHLNITLIFDRGTVCIDNRIYVA